MGTVEKEEKNVKYSQSEEELRRLWRSYYRHMGIEERRNPGKEETSFQRNTGPSSRKWKIPIIVRICR